MTSRLRPSHLLTVPSDKAQGRARTTISMSESETEEEADRPELVNVDHVTNICTDAERTRKFVEAPEGK